MVKITIFGVGGTGTSTIRELFSKKTDFISKNASDMLRGKAKELGIDISELMYQCKNDSSLDKLVDDETKRFGKNNDNFIFEGRLAWYCIPDSLKVKIICDDDIRIKRIMDRDNEDKNEALKKLDKREEADKLRYKQFYGIENYLDDRNFDLIIDSSNKTPQEIVSIILKEIKK